ncbi:TetR/AcrR family transcriptional regulator [Microbacterium lushaniae]|uniref:TetR/AcrR family transcriptional regulator n=1 Tax=Microbacterium lushaniae TaxID=2614639 RepID=A0A5J6KZX3_9MICO|nr:TetR family transcriptional regulator [Microbacterium lushaniae]QEW01793.1 TetR/AcrR family transcriptional regulator [Microbacterium lushaniae]
MTRLRADAARSRDAILCAARRIPRGELRLNDVAREAGVGVATVYRHFPTVAALSEALSLDSIQRLRVLAGEAERTPDAGAALHTLLAAALELQLADEGVQAVITAPDAELGAAREAKCAFVTSLRAALERAQVAGAVRPDITVDHVRRMLCGIEHAVRLGSPDDRPILLDVVLGGLRPARAAEPSSSSSPTPQTAGS